MNYLKEEMCRDEGQKKKKKEGAGIMMRRIERLIADMDGMISNSQKPSCSAPTDNLDPDLCSPAYSKHPQCRQSHIVPIKQHFLNLHNIKPRYLYKYS